jgi:hypothetical protein
MINDGRCRERAWYTYTHRYPRRHTPYKLSAETQSDLHGAADQTSPPEITDQDDGGMARMMSCGCCVARVITDDLLRGRPAGRGMRYRVRRTLTIAASLSAATVYRALLSALDACAAGLQTRRALVLEVGVKGGKGRWRGPCASEINLELIVAGANRRELRNRGDSA